jgi:DNA repair protein RecO (recombination protein O)
MHELFVCVEDRGRELGVLKEAQILRARQGIVSSLASMEVAGRALRWVRHVCPAKTPEPGVWIASRELFDDLESGSRDQNLARLVAFGFRLLAEVGYGLDFQRCIRCAKSCPEGRSAFLDVGGGGLVCMQCGGSRRTMPAELRAIAAQMQQRWSHVAMTDTQARELIAIAEEAMVAHTGFVAL